MGAQTFRADIEGLRGLSVLAVILYHAFPTLVSGGFIGVDVFFVISGFLITRLLLQQITQTGGIDLGAFWARRIRRILPAATLVLCSTAVLILFMPSLDARELGRHIIAAGLFYYNVRQANDAVDYLAADHRDSPFLHYWSLAVEEQFYIVWPLLLMVLVFAVRAAGLRNPIKPVIGLVALLGLASFAYSVYLTQTQASVAFFDTFSRAWQLLSGAFMAALLSSGIQGNEATVSRVTDWLRAMTGVAALLVLTASFFIISGSQPYPGLAAAVPTISAALLIYLNERGSQWSVAALSQPALRLIGRVSYSWYLWHWPALVFGRLIFGDTPVVLMAMIAISLALAAASYVFIERPLQRTVTLIAAPAATYAFGGLLLGIAALTGIASRFLAPDAVHIGSGVYVSAETIKRSKPVIYDDGCLVRFDGERSPPCIYGNADASRTVVLLGDSHAGNWFPALEAAAQAERWRLVVRIKASCRPIDAPQTVSAQGKSSPYPQCLTWLQYVLREIETLRPDLIVVAGTRHSMPIAAELGVFKRLAAVAPAMVMRDTPWLPESSTSCLRRTRDPEACTWPIEKAVAKNTYPRTRPADLPVNVSIMDLNDRICPNDQCRSVIGPHVVMFDRHHLTSQFSETLADAFRTQLVAATR